MTSRGEALRSGILFLARAGCGTLLFYLHGLDKIKGAYGHFAHGNEWAFPGMVSSAALPMTTLLALYAVFAEGVASVFLTLGLFTRLAALAIVISMAGAVYFHMKTGTKPELALLYGLLAFPFVVIDPGRIAFDSLRRRRR